MSAATEPLPPFLLTARASAGRGPADGLLPNPGRPLTRAARLPGRGGDRVLVDQAVVSVGVGVGISRVSIGRASGPLSRSRAGAEPFEIGAAGLGGPGGRAHRGRVALSCLRPALRGPAAGLPE